MTKDEIRKELSMYINMQNDRIEVADLKGETSCEMIEVPKEYMKREFEYYYRVMIGYEIKDNMIYFKQRKSMIADNLFPEIIIKQDGIKDKTVFY